MKISDHRGFEIQVHREGIDSTLKFTGRIN